MLAEWGRRADNAVKRGADATHEAAHATVFYLRRVVGAVSVAAGRVARETRDLAWNYQDAAADLRRPVDTEQPEPTQESVRPRLRVVGSED